MSKDNKMNPKQVIGLIIMIAISLMVIALILPDALVNLAVFGQRTVVVDNTTYTVANEVPSSIITIVVTLIPLIALITILMIYVRYIR